MEKRGYGQKILNTNIDNNSYRYNGTATAETFQFNMEFRYDSL